MLLLVLEDPDELDVEEPLDEPEPDDPEPDDPELEPAFVLAVARESVR